MAIHYGTEEERKIHLSAIHSLADRYDMDESKIRDLYESKLEELMDHARIRIYLSVLATRYVKNYLSHAHVFGDGKLGYHLLH